ncbi:unnamed protein product [Brassicogethes aeneus]|uniref:Uncharacterized protein n=1 Tax=Brassicogethes aeneus TaxID=1431903 RepID=A0A9P0AYH9_BRAAE|nr:unnamed protein product [Brassicogethes aeneus]
MNIQGLNEENNSSDSDTIEKLNMGSKKRKSFGREVDVMKKLRISSHEQGEDCKCRRYKCFEILDLLERKRIIKDFNEIFSKDEQSSYLTGLINVLPIKQRRPRQNEELAKFHDRAYSYKVRTMKENNIIEVPVCRKAFLSLHGISGRWLQTIQQSLKKCGKSPKDMRGKYSHTHCTKPPATLEAVKNHIGSFKGRQSHYSRKKSTVVYLPESLNLKKMYKMYTDLNLGSVSYEYYRKIFNNNFNIKFGYPRSDTCSSCDKFTAEKLSLERKLENTLTAEGKTDLMQQLKNLEIQNELHLKKADVFYARKRAAKKRSIKVMDYESIAMDFQKNFPLPNISTNDVYYKRQLSFYSFNIHVLSTADSYFYCYSENVAAKGSEEVISMLHHFIFTQLDKRLKQLEIFCDSCEPIKISLEKWENLQQLKTFCETDGASEFYGNLPYKLTRKAKKKTKDVLHTLIETDSEKDEEEEQEQNRYSKTKKTAVIKKKKLLASVKRK